METLSYCKVNEYRTEEEAKKRRHQRSMK